MSQLMLYAGAGIIAIWGIAHLANTKGALDSFEPMSVDTRRVTAMEWIMEGLTLTFIATLVVLVTAVADAQGLASTLVFRVSAGMLLVMAVVSLFTGARVSFWAYRLCPAIFGTSAVLFWIGSLGL